MRNLLKFTMTAFALSLFCWGANADPNPHPNDVGLNDDASTQSVCLNDTKLYGVEYTTGSSYTWATGIGADETAVGGAWVAPGTNANRILTAPTDADSLNFARIKWLTTGSYVVRVIEENATFCKDTVYLYVTVNNLPIVLSQDTTVCSQEEIGIELETTSINGMTIATYDIVATTSVTANPLFSGTATAGTGLTAAAGLIASDAFINKTGSSVTVTYTLTPYAAGGCKGNDSTVTVIVMPEPVFTDSIAPTVTCSATDAAASGHGQSLPTTNGTTALVITEWNITAIDYATKTKATYGGAGMTKISGENAGVKTVANAIANDKYKNVSGDTVLIAYTITPTSGDCEGDPFTFFVPIAPQPIVTSPVEKTVCSNDAIAQNLATTDDSGKSLPITKWNVVVPSSLPSGVTRVSGAISANDITAANYIASDVYQNISGSSQTVIYAITPVGANGCVGDPYNIEITITDAPAVPDTTVFVCSDVSGSGIGVSLLDNVPAANIPDVTGYHVVSAVADARLLATPTFAYPTLANTAGLAVTAYNVSTKVDSIAPNAIAGDKFRNLTNDTLYVTYTVIPYTTCEGPSATFRVGIKPEPVVEDTVSNACSNEINGLIADDIAKKAAGNMDLTGVTYTISNAAYPNLTGTPATCTSCTATALASAIQNAVFTNSSTTTDYTVTYTVTPTSAAGCAGETFDVVITIYKKVETSKIYHD